ncbi:MAG: ribonuclease R [bacterium]
MLKEKIVTYLREEADRPLRIRELASALDIPEDDYRGFRSAIKALVREGRVARLKGNRYGAPSKFGYVTGHVHATRHGYIFIEPESGGDEDIYVGANATEGALHGDLVQVKVLRRRPKGLEGRVIRVLKRANETLVGFLARERNVWFIEPENNKITRDVVVDSDDLKGGGEGDMVVVKVDRWGSENRIPSGHIIEVLGDPEDPEVEMQALVRRAGLVEEFPPPVEEEASRAASASIRDEIARRKDLREEIVFTIDPADAKDFDDAISVEQLGGGKVRVGIHIADVSHYVGPDTELDREAWKRGNSVYLVDRVIPMLPEKLSNGACSLRPGEDKLAFSCFVELDGDGRPGDVEIVDTVIRSRARLTYEDAQTIIDTGNPPAGAEVPREVSSKVLEAAKVAEKLTERRMERGTIDFDLPEPIIELDEEGFPLAMRERLRLASHRLVEEFMILANEAVARRGRGLNAPFVYRVHDKPDPEQMQEFREFTASLGWTIPKSDKITPDLFNSLLKQIDGEPAEDVINKVMLRHMRQALYSVECIGHFGLASDCYTHFTSPIRRYPDLVVHRLLRRYRDGVPRGREEDDLEGRLRETCEQASQRERSAMEAERESIKLKQVTYMEDHVGEVFPGIISGVTSFGVFVELEDLVVDGLIHISELDDDYYVYEEKSYRLVGERKRKQYRLGDRIVVKVVRADRTTRQLDFVPAAEEDREAFEAQAEQQA